MSEEKNRPPADNPAPAEPSLPGPVELTPAPWIPSYPEPDYTLDQQAPPPYVKAGEDI